MASAQFTVGERVRVRAAIPVARAGTVGTVQLVYRSADDLYEVQFGGDTHPELMYVGELERADSVRSAQ